MCIKENILFFKPVLKNVIWSLFFLWYKCIIAISVLAMSSFFTQIDLVSTAYVLFLNVLPSDEGEIVV